MSKLLETMRQRQSGQDVPTKAAVAATAVLTTVGTREWSVDRIREELKRIAGEPQIVG